VTALKPFCRVLCEDVPGTFLARVIVGFTSFNFIVSAEGSDHGRCTDIPRNPPPDDMHWGISYLREDIQDLRLGIRAIHDRVDRQGETLTQRIDSVNENLTRRIDSRFAMLLTAMIALNGLTAGSIITFLKFYLP